jgi:hypothetical protein
MSAFDRGGPELLPGLGGVFVRRRDFGADAAAEFVVGEDTGPFEVSAIPEVVHGKV